MNKTIIEDVEKILKNFNIVYKIDDIVKDGEDIKNFVVYISQIYRVVINISNNSEVKINLFDLYNFSYHETFTNFKDFFNEIFKIHAPLGHHVYIKNANKSNVLLVDYDNIHEKFYDEYFEHGHLDYCNKSVIAINLNKCLYFEKQSIKQNDLFDIYLFTFYFDTHDINFHILGKDNAYETLNFISSALS